MPKTERFNLYEHKADYITLQTILHINMNNKRVKEVKQWQKYNKVSIKEFQIVIPPYSYCSRKYGSSVGVCSLSTSSKLGFRT